MKVPCMLVAFSATLALALAQTAHEASILAHRRSEWLMGTPAHPSQPVEWRVELTQPAAGLAWLEETFWAVSTPGHDQYGQHVTTADIHQAMSLPTAVVEAISAWARSTGGIVRLSSTGDYLFCLTPAAGVQKLFGLPVHEFRHATSGTRLLRTSLSLPHVPSSLPSSLRPFVARIVGVSDFPVKARRFSAEASRRGPVAQASSAVKVTPPFIWKAYGFGDSPTSFTSAQASQSVAEFEQAYFYPSDLLDFEKMYGLAQRNLTNIVGKNDPTTGYLGECSLDVEYIQVTGRGIDTWMFSQGPFDMTQWAQTVLSTTGAPLVHSVSWGSGEQSFQASEMNRANTEFQKMGAIGMTVLTASGDEGTGSTGFLSCGSFSPTFPASSPYVTAVGGTTILEAGAAESGWKDSGGGFSTVFARPSYQDQAVSQYLSGGTTLPPQKYWNNTGRGLPDVSAVATNFQVLISDYLGPLSGTSAATPTWAGTLSLMNGLRAQAGKKPIGFANPLLYSLGSGVGTDITAGFLAATGWDAITGLGTPIVDTLKSGLV